MKRIIFSSLVVCGILGILLTYVVVSLFDCNPQEYHSQEFQELECFENLVSNLTDANMMAVSSITTKKGFTIKGDNNITFIKKEECGERTYWLYKITNPLNISIDGFYWRAWFYLTPPTTYDCAFGYYDETLGLCIYEPSTYN